MAYRRRQGISRSSTFKEEIHYPPFDSSHDTLFSSSSSSSSSSSPSSSSSSSLAAQAIRASAAHRESSLSSAYAADNLRSKSFAAYEGQSPDNESKSGFWGVLARKAKAIIEDDNIAQQYETAGRTRFQSLNSSAGGQQPYQSLENSRKMENPTLRKGFDKITSSLNQLGGTFEKAFEEGRTMVESKTADIIEETRKLQIKRKGNISEAPYQAPDVNNSSWQPLQPQIQTNHETQLKASRDVALATAAKAKLLLRELKTVKADLAFAKERCSQLEEENKIHRENREKGEYRADDDLIRLQLETLLAEKARLANENSIYARENRFLREIVEFHQLTMQDVVYLDEGMEEVTEVYPISSPGISSLISSPPHSPTSPSSSSPVPPPGTDHPPEMGEIFHSASHSEEAIYAALEDEVPPTSTTSDQEKNTKTSPDSSV